MGNVLLSKALSGSDNYQGFVGNSSTYLYTNFPAYVIFTLYANVDDIYAYTLVIDTDNLPSANVHFSNRVTIINFTSTQFYIAIERGSIDKWISIEIPK